MSRGAVARSEQIESLVLISIVRGCKPLAERTVACRSFDGYGLWDCPETEVPEFQLWG